MPPITMTWHGIAFHGRDVVVPADERVLTGHQADERHPLFRCKARHDDRKRRKEDGVKCAAWHLHTQSRQQEQPPPPPAHHITSSAAPAARITATVTTRVGTKGKEYE
eukprot:363863-Chlamydomonas_euryale.AAC.5